MLRVVDISKNSSTSSLIDCVRHDTFGTFFAQQHSNKIELDAEKKNDETNSSNKENIASEETNNKHEQNFDNVDVESNANNCSNDDVDNEDYEMNNENRATFEKIKKQLKNHILQLADVVVITIFNASDHALYSAFQFDFIIVDEAARLLKTNIGNIFDNYAKTLLILIDNKSQLKSMMLNTSKNNEFVYAIKMSLFHRLKILRHFSVLLNVQYQMMKSLSNMISRLFYKNMIVNDFEIDIEFKNISRSITAYANSRGGITFSMILFNVKDWAKSDAIKSMFNFVNASVVMNLMMKLIQKKLSNLRNYG